MNKNLYSSLGFSSNPFSRLSAEQERGYLEEIYVKPRYFDTLLDDISDGNSRLIFGKRGIGKSSLIFELDRLLNQTGAFSITIDSFDDIPNENNYGALIYMMLEELTTKIAILTTKYKYKIKELSKSQKIKLAFFVKEFYNPVTIDEYQEYINKVRGLETRNWFVKKYNNLFYTPLNVAANAGVEIIGSTISKSLGIDNIDVSEQYKEYFPKASIKEHQRENTKKELIENIKLLKSFLSELIKLIKTLGFKSVVIFFDRIDEVSSLDGRVDRVANFLKYILSDTSFLHDPSFSLVFSLWDQVRDSLNNLGVRYDKFRPITIAWTFDELKEIIRKRLKYFSVSPINYVDLNSIMPTERETGRILSLSYRSPRDAIRLLSHIYDEQSNNNVDVEIFENNSIKRGKLKFVKNYDYKSVIPSGKGKENIIVNVNRLLKIGKTKFKIQDMTSELKISHVTAISYIKIFINLGLVEMLGERDNNAKVYQIQDPKIKYIISRGYKKLEEIHY
ncbi:MAG: hypothetical protein AAF655_21745 [Bacteroidota bacterium]